MDDRVWLPGRRRQLSSVGCHSRPGSVIWPEGIGVENLWTASSAQPLKLAPLWGYPAKRTPPRCPGSDSARTIKHSDMSKGPNYTLTGQMCKDWAVWWHVHKFRGSSVNSQSLSLSLALLCTKLLNLSSTSLYNKRGLYTPMEVCRVIKRILSCSQSTSLLFFSSLSSSQSLLLSSNHTIGIKAISWHSWLWPDLQIDLSLSFTTTINKWRSWGRSWRPIWTRN